MITRSMSLNGMTRREQDVVITLTTLEEAKLRQKQQKAAKWDGSRLHNRSNRQSSPAVTDPAADQRRRERVIRALAGTLAGMSNDNPISID